jgi:hypothetical protein
MSNYKPESPLSRINREAADHPVGRLHHAPASVGRWPDALYASTQWRSGSAWRSWCPGPGSTWSCTRGVLAPRAAWRAAVVVSAGSEWSDLPPEMCRFTDVGEDAPDRPHRRGFLWADLMRRTFGINVLACPRCGGRLRLIALIENGVSSNGSCDTWDSRPTGPFAALPLHRLSRSQDTSPLAGDIRLDCSNLAGSAGPL